MTASQLSRREAQLGPLYARLQQTAADKDWAEVLALGGQIAGQDAHYRDVPAWMEQARAQLRRPPREPKPERKPPKLFPLWAWGILGAVIMIACVVGLATVVPALLPTATPTLTRLPTATPTTRTMTRTTDGMVMVYVPAGEFLMGNDQGGEDDEKPQHKVYLDAFWIDRTEVTNALFARFATATGYKTDAEKGGSGWVFTGTTWSSVSGADWRHPGGPATSINGLDNHPVVQTSWNDAKAYCQWAGAALPTEAQWEKAARGTDGRLYPWGNQAATCEYAVMDDGNGNGCGKGNAAWPVGSKLKGASPYGALDMAGNVWEWVEDWYDGYPGTTYKSGNFGQKYHVLRGGSWRDLATYVRAADRYNVSPDFRSGRDGFRCVGSGPGGNH